MFLLAQAAAHKERASFLIEEGFEQPIVNCAGNRIMVLINRGKERCEAKKSHPYKGTAFIPY
jgi:hypothetical protein